VAAANHQWVTSVLEYCLAVHSPILEEAGQIGVRVNISMKTGDTKRPRLRDNPPRGGVREEVGPSTRETVARPDATSPVVPGGCLCRTTIDTPDGSGGRRAGAGRRIRFEGHQKKNSQSRQPEPMRSPGSR